MIYLEKEILINSREITSVILFLKIALNLNLLLR